MIKKFGLLKQEQTQTAQRALSHPGNLYAALMDRQALWDPKTIEKVLATFPKDYIDEADLFLILAECTANAVLHGQAEALGFHARERHGVLLLSFFQIPPMMGRIALVLSLARSGNIKECTEELPGGLGFPILLKLVYRITISTDYACLRLWLRTGKRPAEQPSCA